MPEKVLPSELDFKQFEESIAHEGFRPISNIEFSTSFRRLGLEASKDRKGRETGFVFSANGLTVVVWTTFLRYEKCAREEDSGWVLIAEGDKVRYFSHPMMRTAGFLTRVLTYAKIAKERVQGRPLCLSCKCFMKIAWGKGRKSRYWSCPRGHGKLDWDVNLSQDSINFLKKERLARRRYREGLKKTGKTVTPAMLIRRPWKVRRPQNKI